MTRSDPRLPEFVGAWETSVCSPAAQETLRTLSASRGARHEGFSSGQRHSWVALFRVALWCQDQGTKGSRGILKV